MPEIQDFADSRSWVIETTLKERYDREVECSLGNADNRLAPSDRELSVCPAL